MMERKRGECGRIKKDKKKKNGSRVEWKEEAQVEKNEAF